MALLLQTLGFFLNVFVVLFVLLGILLVLRALIVQLHSGEQIARHLGLIPADGFGLVIGPLIRSFLLFLQLFSDHDLAGHGDNGKKRRQDRHGGGHLLVKWFFGLFGVFLQLFVNRHCPFMIQWRTHSCVPRSHSCERWPFVIGVPSLRALKKAAGRRHECRRGTQECVRHSSRR